MPDGAATRRFPPPLHVWACAAALGLAQASGAAAPLESAVGLPLLYALRGVETPPDLAAIVAIDRETVRRLSFDARRLDDALPRLAPCLPQAARETLDLARNVEDLPRALYACAVDELTRLGVAAVVLDVHFHEATDPADDRALAAALAGAPRAIILETITPVPGAPEIFVRERPAPDFADAADAVGFFVVETTGADVARYVSRFAAFPDARPLPDLALAAPPATAAPQSGRSYRALRYYGPPGTAPTVNMIALFEGPARTDLAGKTVFIGSSDPGGGEVRDSFETPFSGAALGDTGGVEIVATAFLNSATDSHLRVWPPWAEGLTVAAASLAILWAGFAAGGFAGAALTLALAAGGLAAALAAFAHGHFHAPVAAMMLGATPLAALMTLGGSYRNARELVRHIMPTPIARLRLRGGGASRDPGHLEDATVMITDLAGSTGLGERLPPRDLQALMSRYYDIVENAVEAEGGVVIKFLGDGVLAMFPASISGPTHPARACMAARSIIAALRAAPVEGGTVRIGVNSGEVMIGDIGAAHHYSVDALGDAVNVADRLQALAKTLFPNGREIVMVGEATRDHPSANTMLYEECGVQLIEGRDVPISVSRLVI